MKTRFPLLPATTALVAGLLAAGCGERKDDHAGHDHGAHGHDAHGHEGHAEGGDEGHADEVTLTADAVKRHFGKLTRGSVTRYELPNLGAFNFVLEETLQGGVNDSLNLDTHGKSRSVHLLAMMVEVPADHPTFAKRVSLTQRGR